jgi:hypothetical protein
VLLGHFDARVAERDRDVLERNTGLQESDRERIAESMGMSVHGLRFFADLPEGSSGVAGRGFEL